MNQYIKVIGRGEAAARPDGVRMYIQVCAEDSVYENAVKTLSAFAGEVGGMKIGESVGEKRGAEELPQAVRALSFDIGTTEMKRYSSSAEFCVEFPARPEICADALLRLADYACRPMVTMEYYVRNMERETKAALEQAVEDAKNRAQILAGAAGKRLGTLQRMEQLRQETILPQTVLEMEMASPVFEEESSVKELFQRLTPEKIRTVQEVEMCWEMC